MDDEDEEEVEEEEIDDVWDSEWRMIDSSAD